jgi:hypothetical protein
LHLGLTFLSPWPQGEPLERGLTNEAHAARRSRSPCLTAPTDIAKRLSLSCAKPRVFSPYRDVKAYGLRPIDSTAPIQSTGGLYRPSLHHS